ncbi:DVU0772 family protein [Pseudodesulfovibrio sp.]|uniref:DVU0772 family protein n=1 Tax=Pseudodesulfovibrio sp. TaxID=2035812 RepID=UPI0026273FE4|nr:hypothetical protein [Pseudodesulfovibrio sp.]MDD3311793.1 hypothetical protein [Pseudodesulfovibrio sp.]
MQNLRDYRNLDIDWTMTPEAAVTLYLEWGNNAWRAEHGPVTGKYDSSTYFVVYAWDENPRLMLIRRNSEGAEELLNEELPHDVGKRFLESVSHLKGVYPPNREVREWIERQFSARQ